MKGSIGRSDENGGENVYVALKALAVAEPPPICDASGFLEFLAIFSIRSSINTLRAH